MKKTISLVLAFVFIFILALQLPVLAENNNETTTTTTIKTTSNKLASSSFEKIPSPDKINLFTNIRKIGNDLFGIKKASSTIAKITQNDEKKAEAAKNALEKRVTELKKAGLEKITSLGQIKFFEKITKVGNDLFGIKKKGAIFLPKMTPELIACTSAAITAKDTSINISLTTSTTEITAAIDARGTCQKAAIALASGQEEALKVCNDTFKTTAKASYEKARKAQQEAWEVYKTSLKNCSPEISLEDGGEILK